MQGVTCLLTPPSPTTHIQKVLLKQVDKLSGERMITWEEAGSVGVSFYFRHLRSPWDKTSFLLPLGKGKLSF